MKVRHILAINAIERPEKPIAPKENQRKDCVLSNHYEVRELANLTLLPRSFPNEMSNNYLI